MPGYGPLDRQRGPGSPDALRGLEGCEARVGFSWLRPDRFDQALIGLAALGVAFWFLAPAGPSEGGMGPAALVLSLVLGGVLVLRRLVRLGRWVANRVLWRVRHRMIAVFFFVGGVPLCLALFLAMWGLGLVFGPLAVYLNTTQFVQHGERLQAAVGPLLWQLAGTPAADRAQAAEAFLARAAADFPGLAVVAKFGDAIEVHPQGALPDRIPDALADTPMARVGESLYLATTVSDPDTGARLAAAVPLTGELLTALMPGLRIVELAPPEERGPGAAPGPSRRPVAVNEEGALPPAQHALDWPVNWPTVVGVVDWESGEVAIVTYLLRTRPSTLWGRIFSRESDATLLIFRILGMVILGAFAASLLLSLLIATYLTRTLTGQVNELYVGTQHVNRGDFSYRIPERGSDQMSGLSQSFNSMTASVERLVEDSRRHQQLQAELKIAREVQSRLFPGEPPQLSGIEVLGVCRPASSVSGDFYDYVRLGEGRLVISLGDVCGKGISAALVMASLQSILRTQMSLLHGEEHIDPQQATSMLVDRANDELCKGTAPEKFSTLFFGAYDLQSGTLTYCNAGHLPPVLLRNGEISTLEVTGMIVGSFPFAEFEADTVKLQSGDLLVAFTDGLTEPENEQGEEFGDERLRSAVREAAGRPAGELIEHVMNNVVAWTGDTLQQDDMTMLVLRRQ